MRWLYRLRVWFKLRLRSVMLIDSFCKECGRDVHDFVSPDDVWAKVEPLIKRGHTLCYDCFCEKCPKVGLPAVWALVPLDDPDDEEAQRDAR